MGLQRVQHFISHQVEFPSGKGIEYLQLAASYRDPVTKASKTKVLYSFGRKDQVDVDALRRLVESIRRFPEPQEVESLQE